MQYKCRVTVIDKKCFPELQNKYLADPKSGECPFYNVGDTFLFERYGDEDTFWREGNGTQWRFVEGHRHPRDLHGVAGRQHHAELDERRTHDDRVL